MVGRHGIAQYDPVRRLLTVSELAETLRIGRTSVYRLVNAGAIRTVVVGKRIRFRPEDVEEYLDRDAERELSP